MRDEAVTLAAIRLAERFGKVTMLAPWHLTRLKRRGDYRDVLHAKKIAQTTLILAILSRKYAARNVPVSERKVAWKLTENRDSKRMFIAGIFAGVGQVVYRAKHHECRTRPLRNATRIVIVLGKHR